MGLFSNLFSRSSSGEPDHAQRFFRGEDIDSDTANTTSGVNVTIPNALALTTVYACIRVISQTMAMLPLITYERVGDDGKRRAYNNPIHDLLKVRPNPEQTAFDWRSLMSVHQSMWGAGISEIEFDRSGAPVALWPLPPWRVTPMRSASGAVFYRVLLDDGRSRDIPAYRTLVFRAMSTSALEWMSPISQSRETIGYAKALNAFGAKTFGQGTNPAGIVRHPGRLREESEQSLRKQFGDNYSGLGNSHRIMLLEDGMDFQRIGLPPEDAQYIESRSWTVAELARIWNVPLHLLQDHSKATTWGSGLEELNLGYLTFTVQPILEQWEQEIQRRLFSDNKYFAEFLTISLLRGRTSERYNAYVQARQNGWMSANDIRRAENLNPIPADEGGDDYLVQLNMQKLSTVGADENTSPNSEKNTPVAE